MSVDLPEKSRVVQYGPMERNFHIFYQLVAGCDAELRTKLLLPADASSFNYLKCVSEDDEITQADATNFKRLVESMTAIGIDSDDQQSLFDGITAILHLGNIEFMANGEEGKSGVVLSSDAAKQSLEKFCSVLGLKTDDLL